MSPLCPLLHFLCLTLLLPKITADPVYNKDSVYRAIQHAPSGTDHLLFRIPRNQNLPGFLDNKVYIPVQVIETDSSSTDPVTIYKTKGTKTHIITTPYFSQACTANPSITQPLPSYIEQYSVSRVRSACSYIVPTPVTNTYYIPCDGSEISTIFYYNTFATGKPGKNTATSKSTETTTKYKTTKLPFPTACPNADNIDYVATDHTLWERGCAAYLDSCRPHRGYQSPEFRCVHREMCSV